MIEHAVEYAMKRLKVWQKLGFLGLVFLIPLAIFSYKMVASMRAMGIGFAQQERMGMEYLAPVYTLLEDLQQHRDGAAAFLSGAAGFAERVVGKRGEVLADLRLIDLIDQQLGDMLQTTDRWIALRKRIAQLVEATPADKAQENFQQHTALIEELLSFMVQVGDRSKLVLDPDLDSAYLIDLFVRKAPQLSESLSQARGLGAGIAARKSKTDDERLKLSKVNAFIEVRAQEIRQEIEKALTYNHQLSARLEQFGKTLFADEGVHARQLLNGGSVTVPVEEYFDTTTTAIALSFDLARQVGPALDNLLQTRINRFTWELYSVGLWIFVGIIVVALIGLVVVRNITAPLQKVVKVAEQIAYGDLSVTVPTEDRTDEFGVLLHAFQRMVQALQNVATVAERIAQGDLTVTVRPQSHKDTMGNVLSKLVQNLREITAQIQNGVGLLNSTTSQVLAATAQVAAGATQTASAVTQTAATVEEVKQTSLIASQKAKNVAESAQTTAHVSRTGEQSVEEAINRMTRIREQMESIADSVIKLGEQSRAIGEIIMSVHDLADQSNLLAVNAAIEAANAGEHGKGFSVVAQEVKMLAEQSKQATAQVRTILSEIQKATNVAVMVTEQGTKAVEAGVAQSLEAGGSIRVLAKSMAEAAQAVVQIAASSQQQALGMDQVAIAVESIKEASNQNVTSMSQVEKGMQHMHELGQRLQQVVGRYKLNGATA
jgi:methyl-accepting chemotaxis protein